LPLSFPQVPAFYAVEGDVRNAEESPVGKHGELAMLLGATPRRATFRKFLMASYARGTLGA